MKATTAQNHHLRLFEPDPALVYSIDAVERLARISRRTILIYCRHGPVSPLADPEFGGYYFNREAIRVLRRIGYLQVTHGVNLAGIKFILDLTAEVQRLRTTLAMYPPPTPSIQGKELICQTLRNSRLRMIQQSRR